MTTIGTAVLQIIPSLKGVSDAIEKQIDGKVVEVKVAPKVDKTVATKAGKEAGETIVKETKAAVTKGKIGQAVADDITTSVKKASPGKEIAKTLTDDVKKSSPGREIAKAIVDGLADGVKQGLPTNSVGSVLADKIADGLKQGIETKGLGTQIIGSITSVIKSGDLGGKIKDAVLPGIAGIGEQLRGGAAEWSKGIADSLRSGDIKGATDDIAATVTKTTDIIATIGTTFGLQTDGVRDSGEKISGFISTVGDTVTDKVIPNLEHINPVFDALEGKAKISAGNISSALALIAIPEALYEIINGAAQAKIKQLDDAFWKRHDEDDRARDLGLKPENPGIGQVGGPPAVGQGNRAFMPVAPHLPDELRTKVAAGQLPGFSLSPNGVIIGPDGKPVPVPARAMGGQISGPGTGISDSILMRASNGEFVVNADATRKSLPLLEIINSGKLPGYAGGGLVAGDQQLRQIIMQRFGISDIGGYRPADKYGEHSTGRALDVMVGNNKAKGDAVKDFALQNASAIDLKWAIWRQHLYYPGGGGYDMPDRGSPTQNHMDHVHIFSGTGITNGLRGALAGGPGAGIAAGVGVPQAGGPGAEDTSAGDQTAAAAASSGGGVGLPSSISGLGSFALNGPGKGVGTTSSGSDLSKLGSAAGSAVSGQISSALGLFGAGDTPPFLQAASTLLGGIKVGGHSGGPSDGSLFDGSNLLGGGRSAAPIAATPTSSGTPPPDGAAHGARAGQAPGPQVVNNVSFHARDAEDAMTKYNRLIDQRVAAKTSVY